MINQRVRKAILYPFGLRQFDAPQYHVVAAGSLLGIAVHENTSFPVGKVQFDERRFHLLLDE
jgi:hypothetical protein